MMVCEFFFFQLTVIEASIIDEYRLTIAQSHQQIQANALAYAVERMS